MTIAPGRYHLTIGDSEAVVCSGPMQTQDMNFTHYDGISYMQEAYGQDVIEMQLKEGDYLYVRSGGCAGLENITD